MNVEAVYDFSVDKIPFREGQFLFQKWVLIKDKKSKTPAREDFTPHDLKEILPSIVLFDVDEKTGAISRRLVGTGVAFALGVDLTNNTVEKKDYNERGIKHVEEVKNLISNLVTDSRPFYCPTIEILNPPTRFSHFSCLYLPLSANGKEINKIISAHGFKTQEK